MNASMRATIIVLKFVPILKAVSTAAAILDTYCRQTRYPAQVKLNGVIHFKHDFFDSLIILPHNCGVVVVIVLYKDINECLTGNGGCQQQCANMPGSFVCSCEDGFQLASDDRGCEG